MAEEHSMNLKISYIYNIPENSLKISKILFVPEHSTKFPDIPFQKLCFFVLFPMIKFTFPKIMIILETSST